MNPLSWEVLKTGHFGQRYRMGMAWLMGRLSVLWIGVENDQAFQKGHYLRSRLL